MWQNRKFHALSDDAKMLWLYLISCPHGNALGAYVLPFGYIIADMRWQPERVTHTVSELLANGFIQRDDTFDLIVIRDWWQHNTIENENVALGAAKTFDLLPPCELLFQAFRDFSALPKALGKRFTERYPNGLPNGIETKKPEPSLAKPEIQPEPQSAPSAALVVKRETSDKRKGTRLAVDAEPDAEDIRYASVEYGWPAERIALEWSNLRDWSQSSRNGAKFDWRATWRTWVRRREGEQPTKPISPSNRRAAIVAGVRGELAGQADLVGGVGGASEPDGERAGEPRGQSADFGAPGYSREPGSVYDRNGSVVRLGRTDGPDARRGRGDGALSGDFSGLASRSAGNGHWTNDPDAPVPQSPETSGHSQTGGGGYGAASVNAERGPIILEGDPLDIPPFLRRKVSAHG
jgi:hypothetical protein